ncbi:MAG: diguanylate cyclase [Pseudomonadota bacterium]
MDVTQNPELLQFIVDRAEVGLFVINSDYELVLWNRFMEHHSGKPAAEVVGKRLFAAFPELPEAWLARKIQNVMILKNYAFTSWKQRPYLFRFPHNRPVTGGVDCMRQNCTFLPIKNQQGEVTHVCITLFDATDESISEQKLQQARDILAESSVRDPLTGLFNRRHLESTLAKEFNRSKRYDLPFSLLLLDLDHFKSINDNHGHLAGDEVLKTAAERFLGSIRDSDTLARYGGEEFAILLPETDGPGALVVAERLRKNIEAAPVIFNQTEIPIRVSVGACVMSPTDQTYYSLLSNADIALYHSKENGRNQCTLYRAEMAEKR